MSAPASGVFNPLSGEWEVENIGIASDVEVEQDPAARKGRDPQLERAVHIVMEELMKNPPADEDAEVPELSSETNGRYAVTAPAA